MKKMTSAALFLACASWFMSIKPSLPDLYHSAGSKRGIPVKSFRLLEKRGLKVTKLKLDVQYFEACLELNLCPPKFKLKDAKVNVAVLRDKINEAVIENALFNVRKELDRSRSEYER